MTELGRLDITIAYPAIGNERALRLAALSCKHNLRVAVDSEYGIDELANAAARHKTVIGIHIIFDAGLHYDGIQMYLGHLYGDAARVVTTIVSDVTPGQVIIDAGSKGLSAKQLLRREYLEMGYIPDYPDARIDARGLYV